MNETCGAHFSTNNGLWVTEFWVDTSTGVVVVDSALSSTHLTWADASGVDQPNTRSRNANDQDRKRPHFHPRVQVQSDQEATVFTFYAPFLPSFHSTSVTDEPGLPLSWLSPEEASSSKRIHLKVAGSTSMRALLLCNNVLYCSTVNRPLISVGQLESKARLCCCASPSEDFL